MVGGILYTNVTYLSVQQEQTLRQVIVLFYTIFKIG